MIVKIAFRHRPVGEQFQDFVAQERTRAAPEKHLHGLLAVPPNRKGGIEVNRRDPLAAAWPWGIKKKIYKGDPQYNRRTPRYQRTGESELVLAE